MPECQLDDCGISCEFGCSCMSDAAGCECWCENISLPPLKKLRVREARDPEAYVNFSASGMPLVRLAELFDDLFPGQILMPVSKMQEKVTTDEELRQIKLGDLVEYLGLVPVRTPLPGRATPAHRRRGLKPCIDTPLHTAALIWVVADPRARVTSHLEAHAQGAATIP